jgi:ABC-2 type transport system ATP-binding protein
MAGPAGSGPLRAQPLSDTGSTAMTAPVDGAGGDEVVRAEGLVKSYPPLPGAAGAKGARFVAVDHLDLSVRRGEIFGLLGPNGAGKTTTVGMLTTRVAPTSGRALVNGFDVRTDPVRVKQSIGVVPDVNTLDRSLTVRENLSFHGRYFGMDAKEAAGAADAMLERFRLQDRAHAPVNALSRGMAQRLMVARALLHRPAVVFMDEPTAGLDPQSRLAMWELMEELHGRGQTILLTTHYMEEADQFCDRVAIIDHGRILALDTPAGLKRSARAGADVTVKGDGDLDRLAAELATMAGASDARRVDGTVRLHLETAEDALPRVIATAERGGFKVRELAVSEATLETVFIGLTGKDLRE